MATATKKTTAKKTVNKAAETTGAEFFTQFEDMTAAAREQFEEAMAGFTGHSEEWREKAEEVLADVRARFEKNREFVADLNAELVEAAKTEVSEAVQFASDLGKAKSVTDAFEIQQKYWSNLFETRSARLQDMTAKSVEAAKENFDSTKTDFGAFFDTSAYEKFFAFPAKA